MTAKVVKRVVALAATLAIFYFLVLPTLIRGGDAADEVVAAGSPALLLLALLLQLASLVAYSVMTKLTLPLTPVLTLFTVVRIQLATRAIAHVLPGGAAAGAALGYRLFTTAGVAPPAAGFTITATGVGSAVVLNVMLWATLLASIPVKGFQPVYLTAAVAALVLIGGTGLLVWLLLTGRRWADRVLRAAVRPIPFVKADAAIRMVHQLADRLRELASHPRLVRRGVGWAVANWLLDAASLWVVLHTFGYTLGPIDLLVAFGVAQVLAAIPLTPGGLGIIEAALPAVLVALAGIPIEGAIVGVLGWRLLQFWMPIALGAASYASLKAGVLRSRPSPAEHSASP